ncbi:unnamed protein product [Chrysodeixis includens]|uniref:Secreted protein n=1 Tax=Chrysodeixis includens TaxID=689277 RepID=A0A9N8L5Y0_CHRIL|nr:unnamed protein product [Chrysodeixis includens]
MLVLRCVLLAALVAAAAAAWQENVRPKVFAQLGESTDNRHRNMSVLVNSYNNRLNSRRSRSRQGPHKLQYRDAPTV